MLECLGLLHEVPVTFEVLQSTGIGSTLMAIRIFADTLLLLLLLLLLVVVVVVVVVSNCFVQVWELVLRQRKGAPVFLFTSIYNIYIFVYLILLVYSVYSQCFTVNSYKVVAWCVCVCV